MAGNLVKEDSSSVQDLQDPSITSSGHKRRRGSVQPSSSRAGKKSKQRYRQTDITSAKNEERDKRLVEERMGYFRNPIGVF
ncbi:hypothetical protein NC653_041833 [Populus alba x Populus x berolinensis]|uniref:Uncharacterized protein n=1 Tax=Populus alba x Populus x berolinensis TaxID=444605 RepID=A0AAD6L9I8_9ROSI|nr:hypothetical protein NC653_041833 [Populus alba x Populus x berolinensis]